MKIQLNCGRVVQLDSFHFDHTYAGLLHGTPNAEMNLRMIERSKTRMNKIWGVRKTHLIDPSVKKFEGGESLPRCEFAAWLVSEDPINEESHGSELVVVWFSDYDLSSPLVDFISESVRDINWDALAQDFFY